MFRGNIYITSREEVIYNQDYNQLVRVVSMDEDGILPESPVVIGGTCLLPPPAAKIAEADGNEYLYDSIYISHLSSGYQQEYLAALMTFLDIGGTIIIFLPSLGQDNTYDKFLYHMNMMYGIHIGNMDSKDPGAMMCFYNLNYVAIWLCLIYEYTNHLTTYQFLARYPINLDIPERLDFKVKCDLRPYGANAKEQDKVIQDLRKQLQINPYITLPVERVW